ncbi:MAG: hypothetical protein OEZ06_04785 [Myxococcales bacterium]|nr:hypothetical protein [Myxococcales bacterium]
MVRLALMVGLLLLGPLACGGDDGNGAPQDGADGVMGGTDAEPGSGSAGAAADPEPSGSDPAVVPTGVYAGDPLSAIPADCQGFDLDGLMYSPGGEVLPNICEPFHPTWNNPYAVLCIHAWPWYDSGYLGDEYCILPPEEGKGIQVGFHPQGLDYWAQVSKQDLSGYDAPDSQFVVGVGGEETVNYRTPAGSEGENAYYRTYFRMRTGSHHNIISLHPSAPDIGWIETGGGDALPGLFDPTVGMTVGVLGGQQRPDDNTPVSFEPPPEDEGLYLAWPDNPTILFNLHHFNATDGEVLKEGWVNIWWQEDAQTKISWFMGLPPTQLIALNMPPGSIEDQHYSWTIAETTRLLRLFGHRHVWTTNFSSWIERTSGDVEVVYQSYDWFDMPTFRYDSVAQNPELDVDARVDGAVSGVVNMEPGDKLHFNCHMEFTDERAVNEGAPLPAEIGNLGFANEAYTGEMCIQFGNAVGSSLGLPASDSTPVPDFAK